RAFEILQIPISSGSSGAVRSTGILFSRGKEDVDDRPNVPAAMPSRRGRRSLHLRPGLRLPYHLPRRLAVAELHAVLELDQGEAVEATLAVAIGVPRLAHMAVVVFRDCGQRL